MVLTALRAAASGCGSPAAALGRSATRALLDELATFPKPGLVSLADNGSHADMNAGHFLRSASALRRPFAQAAALGAACADFNALRRWGVEAEVAMSRATGGINTHRGAIFSLGLLCAAAGAPRTTTWGEHVSRQWGEAIQAHRRDPRSHGSAATRLAGAGGAQAEAAAGFPSVYAIALPAHRAVLRAGGSPSQASVQAFFALLASVSDTNLLHRGGVDGLAFAQRSAKSFLDRGGILAAQGPQRAHAVHRAFVEKRLSPGGSADLLAASLFVLACDPHAP